MNKKYSSFILLFLALLCGAILFYLNYDNEYHVHADFLVSINGEKINFSQSIYQSTATKVLHPGVHLHDGWGDVIHYHSPGITLQKFFESLSMNLTNQCITTIDNVSYCENETHTFEVYLNNEVLLEPQEYVAEDLDQLAIVYYPSGFSIDPILENVTDKACIQSALCPERGEPSEGTCVTGETCQVDLTQFE